MSAVEYYVGFCRVCGLFTGMWAVYGMWAVVWCVGCCMVSGLLYVTWAAGYKGC